MFEYDQIYNKTFSLHCSEYFVWSNYVFLAFYKGVRARLHQYFIFGERVDCSQWKKDYENCIEFRHKKNTKALVSYMIYQICFITFDVYIHLC